MTCSLPMFSIIIQAFNRFNSFLSARHPYEELKIADIPFKSRKSTNYRQENNKTVRFRYRQIRYCVDVNDKQTYYS